MTDITSSQSPREDYKRFPFVIDAPAEAMANLSDAINLHFDLDEIRLYKNGDSYELWLRQISLDGFDDTIRQIQKSHADLTPLLAQFEKRVRGVGSYALKSGKKQFVGYNRERKVIGRKGKEARRGKHFYANDNDFAKANNPLPVVAENKMVCADSEDYLKTLPDNCVDLVFTSPPYNFGLDYDNKGDDAVDWEAYFAKLFRVFDECIRVLKHGGRMAVNISPLFSDYIPTHHIISHFLMQKRMIWKGEILWEKNNYNCKYSAWGSWKSPSSPYLKYTWEFLEVFCKGDLKKEGSPANADIDGDSFKKWVLAKWSIAPERNMKEFDHPAMFPEELARRTLLLFSFKGDVILDPFAGVGTTCTVAKQLNRRYLGIDISPAYCQMAEKRIAGTIAKRKLFND